MGGKNEKPRQGDLCENVQLDLNFVFKESS